MERVGPGAEAAALVGQGWTHSHWGAAAAPTLGMVLGPLHWGTRSPVGSGRLRCGGNIGAVKARAELCNPLQKPRPQARSRLCCCWWDHPQRGEPQAISCGYRGIQGSLQGSRAPPQHHEGGQGPWPTSAEDPQRWALLLYGPLKSSSRSPGTPSTTNHGCSDGHGHQQHPKGQH